MTSDHINDKVDGIAVNLRNIQEQERLLQEQLESVRKQRYEEQRRLRQEQAMTAKMKQSIWRSKDIGVISARNELLEVALADFLKTDAGKRWDARPIIEEIVVGGETFTLPDLFDDRSDIQKKVRVFKSKHKMSWCDPLGFILDNFVNQRKEYAAQVKKHVWKSMNTDVIEKRRNIMVAMKLM